MFKSLRSSYPADLSMVQSSTSCFVGVNKGPSLTDIPWSALRDLLPDMIDDIEEEREEALGRRELSPSSAIGDVGWLRVSE